jgi:hypothetical protein
MAEDKAVGAYNFQETDFIVVMLSVRVEGSLLA